MARNIAGRADSPFSSFTRPASLTAIRAATPFANPLSRPSLAGPSWTRAFRPTGSLRRRRLPARAGRSLRRALERTARSRADSSGRVGGFDLGRSALSDRRDGVRGQRLGDRAPRPPDRFRPAAFGSRVDLL